MIKCHKEAIHLYYIEQTLHQLMIDLHFDPGFILFLLVFINFINFLLFNCITMFSSK